MDEWERIQKLSTEPETHRVDNIGMLHRAAIEGCLDPNYKEASDGLKSYKRRQTRPRFKPIY
ncbi:MAG: hypothetical protein J6S69_05095 [Proteobacteria bacterium]|nr:hypothetical protein [Pseudomonadota bacterium]